MTNDRAASDQLVHNPDGGLPRLLEIMARLRDPQGGCPWDLEQTFATIAPYTIEEAYEVADAIERQAWHELKSELGDLLFQAVYHAANGIGGRALQLCRCRKDHFRQDAGPPSACLRRREPR